MDDRVLMCKEINFGCNYKGQFVPCIGTGGKVNYVFRDAIITLLNEDFAKLHEAEMRAYRALAIWEKYKDAASILSRSLLGVELLGRVSLDQFTANED